MSIMLSTFIILKKSIFLTTIGSASAGDGRINAPAAKRENRFSELSLQIVHFAQPHKQPLATTN